MSFIIRRGYAEVQILKQVKLTFSWTVWKILISKFWKNVKLKWTLHIFMRKKVQTQDIIVLCVWDGMGMGMERGGEGRTNGQEKKTRKYKL